MLLSNRAYLFFALTIVAPAANAAELNATASNFSSVFASAKAGDTIRLSGNFGRTNLNDRNFSSLVTIDAYDARFTDSMVIRNVSNLAIVGGNYGSSTGNTAYLKAVAVYASNNVSLSNAYVQGVGTGTGIAFQNSKNVNVANVTVERLKTGVGVTSVTGGTITNVTSRASASDGFDIVDSHQVTVSGNSCVATAPGVGAHPDCVQLWSIKGHAPQSDITITGNTATGKTQGFTSFNPADGGGVRISITNNRVNTSMPQGIACYACVDSTITGNILTTLPGSAQRTTINVIGGSDNTVANNSIGERLANSTLALNVAVDPTTSDFLAYRTDAARASRPGERMATQAATAAVAAVPEPAAWMMMITGFGLVGRMMRRRRQNRVLA